MRRAEGCLLRSVRHGKPGKYLGAGPAPLVMSARPPVSAAVVAGGSSRSMARRGSRGRGSRRPAGRDAAAAGLDTSDEHVLARHDVADLVDEMVSEAGLAS